jgi:hypothetical protein
MESSPAWPGVIQFHHDALRASARIAPLTEEDKTFA